MIIFLWGSLTMHCLAKTENLRGGTAPPSLCHEPFPTHRPLISHAEEE
ncbi:hypothetical protein [Chitinivibrio alkaliphilus]|nr:hypothetical protein [Chitinivibrio alkaliphilus]